MTTAPADAPDDDAASGGEATSRLALDELATLAGLTPRTVRYYIQQGLLSRPVGTKRGAHYTRAHLDELLLIRRHTDAGASLDEVRAIQAGAPAAPEPQPARPGRVEVWSRVTLADGLELHVEPGRAGLGPEQLRAFVRELTTLYRRARADAPPRPAGDVRTSVRQPREQDDA